MIAIFIDRISDFAILVSHDFGYYDFCCSQQYKLDGALSAAYELAVHLRTRNVAGYSLRNVTGQSSASSSSQQQF